MGRLKWKSAYLYHSHQATGTLIPSTILAFLQCGQGGQGAGGGGGGTVTGGEGTVRGTNGTMECVTPILKRFKLSSCEVVKFSMRFLAPLELSHCHT